jgi:phage-related protein
MTEPVAEQYEESAGFRAELAAIADALRAARKSTRHDPRVLRDAVRACAVNARVHRCPPEKVVRALKALVREIALDDATDAHRVLYTDRVIAWAIESYYELTDR